MNQIITRENVERLGFLDWPKVDGLVEKAFGGQDALAMRFSIVVAQWVVIGQRFNVKRSELESQD